MEFNCIITFYIDHTEDYDGSIEEKDQLLDQLDELGIDYDVEKDEEDWCVNCDIDIECGKKDIDAIDKKLKKVLNDIDCTWNYHYVKGIGNDFYWQP